MFPPEEIAAAKQREAARDQELCATLLRQLTDSVSLVDQDAIRSVSRYSVPIVDHPCADFELIDGTVLRVTVTIADAEPLGPGSPF